MTAKSAEHFFATGEFWRHGLAIALGVGSSDYQGNRSFAPDLWSLCKSRQAYSVVIGSQSDLSHTPRPDLVVLFIGESGGLNLYAMAGNDPVNGFDVLGLNADELPDPWPAPWGGTDYIDGDSGRLGRSNGVRSWGVDWLTARRCPRPTA